MRGRRPRTPAADAPVVEWYGSGALVSDPGDSPYECWRLLDALTASAGGELVVRDARSARLTADDPLLTVPPADEQPGLVVDFDGVPETAVTLVADLFSAVDRRVSRRLTVAPGRQPDAEWLAGLGDRFAPASAEPMVVPRPLALKATWQRQGPRFFQAEEGPVVEVMPGGLLLRPAGSFSAGGLAWFDPSSGDLSVGTPGEPVPSGLVDVIEGTWLDGPVRMRVTGDDGGSSRARLLALASAHGVSCDIDEGVDR